MNSDLICVEDERCVLYSAPQASYVCQVYFTMIHIPGNPQEKSTYLIANCTHCSLKKIFINLCTILYFQISSLNLHLQIFFPLSTILDVLIFSTALLDHPGYHKQKGM